MRIGTMFLGEVDQLDGESIQTKFFVLGVPLVPLSSHYVVKQHYRGISGFDIPLNGKSVGLGYLRIAAWLVAFVCGVMYFVDRRAFSSELAPCVVAAAIAIVSTFVLGRLTRGERTRRVLLRAITGVGAPPDLLPEPLRSDTAQALRERWEKANDGRAWDRAIETGVADVLLFAVAEYHARPDLARSVLHQLVARGEATPPTDGPYR